MELQYSQRILRENTPEIVVVDLRNSLRILEPIVFWVIISETFLEQKLVLQSLLETEPVHTQGLGELVTREI